MTAAENPTRIRPAGERRDELLQAAARVFAHHGFERATTKEIAAEAGVSEGTIYNYFSGKEQLLLQLADMVQQQLGTVIPTPTAHPDLRRSVADALERFFTVIADNTVVIRGLLSALARSGNGVHGYLLPGAAHLLDRVEAFLRANIQAGAIPPCDVHLVARMTVGMAFYVALPYIQDIAPIPSPAQRRQQAESMVHVLFDGLLAQEG